MAALKTLQKRLFVLRAQGSARDLEHLARQLYEVVEAQEKSFAEIITVVNDHADAYDTGWSVANGVSTKALDATGSTLDETRKVLGTLITLLLSKGVLDP